MDGSGGRSDTWNVLNNWGTVVNSNSLSNSLINTKLSKGNGTFITGFAVALAFYLGSINRERIFKQKEKEKMEVKNINNTRSALSNEIYF